MDSLHVLFRDHQEKKVMSGALKVPRYYLNVLRLSDAQCGKSLDGALIIKLRCY